mmetsp:Transcript_36049/g.85535  ORF Transcript_36049/g.85535 Transcript_36049/m.85535 type:complete len:527 (-) Transcript_36049:459-2039(-)
MAVNGSFSCILQPNTCRPRTCSVRNYGNEPCFILRRHKGRPVLVQASATTDSVAAAKPPEKMRGALPVVGNFHQFKFSKLYKDIDDFHKQHDSQALEVSMFRRRSCHTRDPNDCAQIFRDAEVFPKSPDINVVSDWLGEGLATQSNIQKHAEMRRLLNPAFRQDYIKGLSPAFAEVGDRLADALLELGEHDIQDMAARATIDIIGRTGFRYDFGCLDLAMGRRRSGATVEAAGERLDVAKLFDQLVFGVSRIFAFSYFFPRREWIPGSVPGTAARSPLPPSPLPAAEERSGVGGGKVLRVPRGDPEARRRHQQRPRGAPPRGRRPRGPRPHLLLPAGDGGGQRDHERQTDPQRAAHPPVRGVGHDGQHALLDLPPALAQARDDGQVPPGGGCASGPRRGAEPRAPERAPPLFDRLREGDAPHVSSRADAQPRLYQGHRPGGHEDSGKQRFHGDARHLVCPPEPQALGEARRVPSGEVACGGRGGVWPHSTGSLHPVWGGIAHLHRDVLCDNGGPSDCGSSSAESQV